MDNLYLLLIFTVLTITIRALFSKKIKTCLVISLVITSSYLVISTLIAPLDCRLLIEDFAKKYLPPQIVEKIITIKEEEKTLVQLLDEIPGAYGIDKLLVQAVIKTESNYIRNAIRFERHYMNRSDVQRLGRTEDDKRMYASSFGYMQVMGTHAPAHGLQWDDLLKPAVNIEIGVKILKKCLDRHKQQKTTLGRIRQGLICYNGSQEYPDRVLKNVGEIIVQAMILDGHTEDVIIKTKKSDWRIKNEK